MAKEKTLRQIIQRGIKKGGFMDTTAYVYHDGIDVITQEYYKGQKVKLWYRLDIPIKMPEPIFRIVFYNPSYLLFGKIHHINLYEHSTCVLDKKLGIDKHTIIIHYDHGGSVPISVTKYPDSIHYFASEITLQRETNFQRVSPDESTPIRP
jgi:hypothetical protein